MPVACLELQDVCVKPATLAVRVGYAYGSCTDVYMLENTSLIGLSRFRWFLTKWMRLVAIDFWTYMEMKRTPLISWRVNTPSGPSKWITSRPSAPASVSETLSCPVRMVLCGGTCPIYAAD